MPSIVSVGTAVPPHVLTQKLAKELTGRHFSGKIENLEKYLGVFDNALIETRHLCAPASLLRWSS